MADGISSGGISLSQVGSAIGSDSVLSPSGANGATGSFECFHPCPLEYERFGRFGKRRSSSEWSGNPYHSHFPRHLSRRKTPGFDHVGTLNVGDRFVSGSQNSAPTVAARPRSLDPQTVWPLILKGPRRECRFSFFRLIRRKVPLSSRRKLILVFRRYKH